LLHAALAFLVLASACHAFVPRIPDQAACTKTAGLCGTSNSTAPPCCGKDACRPPPDCGGPAPPTSPVYTCDTPPPPQPPGCKKEGHKCKIDSECCEDECNDISCMDGACRALMPPSPSPTIQVREEEGVRALAVEEMGAHEFVSSNDTEYLVAFDTKMDNSCLQIPVLLKTKAIFCHGPYPKADFNEFQLEWMEGKGSCKEQGFDHGPQNSAANVTGQTDEFVCHFTKWDFNQPLPLNLRESSWYKPV